MLTVLILSVTLALDALSVSITEGALTKGKRLGLALKLATTFGGFQAGMAGIGAFLSGLFAETLGAVDHWIAFGIFLILGLKMIKEGYEGEKKEKELSWAVLLVLGLATSIDAGAAGLTLVFLDLPLALSLLLIGGTTFGLCFLGAGLGAQIKKTFTKLPLEVIGGVVLILLAAKALIEGL